MEELTDIAVDSLVRFLTRWYGEPISPISTDPTSAEGLPAPLQAWHEITSCWAVEVAFFNYPIAPAELEIEDGKLVFWVENQGCWEWGASTDEADPFVFDRPTSAGHEPWVSTGERLSEFLLHATVVEAIIGANDQWRAQGLDGDQVAHVLRDLHPLPLPEWRWPAPGTRILVGEGLLAEVTTSAQNLSAARGVSHDVTIAASSPQPLEPLADISGIAWNIYTPASVRIGPDPHDSSGEWLDAPPW